MRKYSRHIDPLYSIDGVRHLSVLGEVRIIAHSGKRKVLRIGIQSGGVSFDENISFSNGTTAFNVMVVKNSNYHKAIVNKKFSNNILQTISLSFDNSVSFKLLSINGRQITQH